MDKFLEGLYNASVVKTALVILITYVIRVFIVRIIHKRVDDTKRYYYFKRTFTYIHVIVLIALLAIIWGGINMTLLGTYLGLVSAGLAIALKDLIINIAAWFFIIIKKPFSVGDRIEIDKQAGDVIDQRLFQFTIMEIGNWVSNDQSTGRMVHLPNSTIFNSPLANYSSGFEYIWNEIDILLTFESNYKKAKPVFLKIAETHSLHLTDSVTKDIKNASKKYMIFYNILTPIVYTDVKENGIMLSIRYLCEPHNRRNTIEKIWEEVLDYINENDDLDLAYNTVRMIKE